MQETAKAYRGMGMEGFTAKWYASLTRKSLDEFKALARRIAKEIPRGSKVLEVAPGPGYFAIELAKLGSYRITGVDISETFVTIARANAAEAKVDVDFRRGNASGMPFDSETFDFLLCRAAFKNFTEPEQALREMCRVLAGRARAHYRSAKRHFQPADRSGSGRDAPRRREPDDHQAHISIYATEASLHQERI